MYKIEHSYFYSILAYLFIRKYQWVSYESVHGFNKPESKKSEIVDVTGRQRGSKELHQTGGGGLSQ